MQENNQNTADTSGIDEESIEEVIHTAIELSEAIVEQLIIGKDIITLQPVDEYFDADKMELVRDIVVATSSEIIGIGVYGAVTDDGEMIFTHVPNQVCEVLSEQTDKEYDDLRNQLVGIEDLNVKFEA